MKPKHDDPKTSGEVKPAMVVVRAPVTDRVNSEPNIINGMTLSEGKWIAVFGLAGYTLLGGLVTLITHLWQFIPLAAIFGTGGTLWYGSLYLAKIKRGRPEGFYSQAIHLWLSKTGMVKCSFMRHKGYWSLGRRIPGFVSPLDVREPLPSGNKS